MKTAKSGLATSGGMSAVSMAACCAHYLVAFLPVLGLTFLSPVVTNLSEYQREFFALGLLANLFGIEIMLRLMEKSGILHFRTLINNLNFGLSSCKKITWSYFHGCVSMTAWTLNRQSGSGIKTSNGF
jgi:hypothetical protein